MTLYELIPNWLNCLEIWGSAVDLLIISTEEEDFTLKHRIAKKDIKLSFVQELWLDELTVWCHDSLLNYNVPLNRVLVPLAQNNWPGVLPRWLPSGTTDI